MVMKPTPARASREMLPVAARTAAMLLALVSMAAARAAAESAPAPEKPLDLTVPRQAGQWTGLDVRTQQDVPSLAASAPTRTQNPAVRLRSQPYGTGYEARRLPGGAAGSPAGNAGAPPAAGPRGRGR